MKKKNEVSIEFIGNNSESVTGSCTLIKFNNRSILFECGGIQEGKTVYDNYKLNRKFLSKIKPKEIDMIILGHEHYDHVGNVCSVVKYNKDVKIITPKNTSGILKEMWLDSANINERDCELLSSQHQDKQFVPYYDIEDVFNILKNIEEYDEGDIYKIDDDISIRYTSSGHIFGAMQCELFINVNNHIKKILFTSDLGNRKIEHLKPFVEPFKEVVSANIVIAETTYGARNNTKISKKTVQEDLDKIKSVVEQFCIDKNKRVLLPVFSLDKCPNILWLLYNMFKDDENFNTKVIVDSPLTNRLLDEYSKVLQGEAKKKFDEMMSWKNLIRIVEPNDSKEAIKTLTNCVILSSGGMLQSGRSVKWCASLLPHGDNCLILNGYCGENTLGWKIKNCSDQKTITINGSQYKNKCQIKITKSFSSHMQRDDLLNYYSNINTEKIYLVHGDMQGKIEFAEDLKKEISNKSKTTKVCVVNKGTKINI